MVAGTLPASKDAPEMDLAPAGFRHGRRPRCEHGLQGAERLEARTLLSAVPGGPAPTGIERVLWHGRAAEARVDQWVGRLAVAPISGHNAVPRGGAVLQGSLSASHPGWRATALAGGFFALSTPGAAPQTVARWAAQTPAVATLEPDRVFHAASVPNDPLFATQWNLLNVGTIGNDIQAAKAWGITTGSRSVVVGVVDSGIDITHPDLAANIWTNPGETPGNGIDDDHNGYVDDVHGWNFVDNTNNVADVYGHGTHVAGIIGAVGNNGTGVTGIDWQVSLMALKFQDSRGIGFTSSMLAALNYATMMRRDRGINVVATNNSWETSSGPSMVVANAIRAQGHAGIMFVAAAGNNATNNDATPRYPGSYRLPNVITVAALNTTDSLASMSNYGATSVDLAAPGSLIQSTFPGGTYGILSGTSMAAPQVTGVVALLAAAKPGITVAEARTAILGSTTPAASLAGKTVTGGRLNAGAALESLGIAPVPPAPQPPLSVPVPPSPASPALPFSDSFNRPNGPVAGAWTQPVGRIAISGNTAVSVSGGNAVMVLRDVVTADVHLRAWVSVRPITGMGVGLVARYGGPGDGNMYLGRLVKRPAGYAAQIWVSDHGVWRLLSMRAAPRGSGLLQFDVVGNRLTLHCNGRVLLDIRDNSITHPGSVGGRTTGIGNRFDNVVAF
jgi:subtilisin family serine protease